MTVGSATWNRLEFVIETAFISGGFLAYPCVQLRHGIYKTVYLVMIRNSLAL